MSQTRACRILQQSAVQHFWANVAWCSFYLFLFKRSHLALGRLLSWNADQLSNPDLILRLPERARGNITAIMVNAGTYDNEGLPRKGELIEASNKGDFVYGRFRSNLLFVNSWSEIRSIPSNFVSLGRLELKASLPSTLPVSDMLSENWSSGKRAALFRNAWLTNKNFF